MDMDIGFRSWRIPWWRSILGEKSIKLHYSSSFDRAFFSSIVTTLEAKHRRLSLPSIIIKQTTMDSSQLQKTLTSIARVSSIARRDMFIPEAARGNDNTLWSTMAGTIQVLSHSYTMAQPDTPIQIYEQEIRDTWYLFILAAKNIDAHHPAQDRLTRLVLWARELDVLRRGMKGHEQEAVTADGRIWIDLPFMVLDVQEAWNSVMLPTESIAQRCNFAAAVARLAGLGVLDEAFSGCGLAVMGLALETLSDQDGSIQTGLRLLPVVQIWLHYAGDKLLRLSIANYPTDESAWCAEVGLSYRGLVREAGIETVGFSQERFIFWKSRLSELKESDDEAMKGVAGACSNIIDGIWNSFFGLR
jgi:hypothetical protein